MMRFLLYSRLRGQREEMLSDLAACPGIPIDVVDVDLEPAARAMDTKSRVAGGEIPSHGRLTEEVDKTSASAGRYMSGLPKLGLDENIRNFRSLLMSTTANPHWPTGSFRNAVVLTLVRRRCSTHGLGVSAALPSRRKA